MPHSSLLISNKAIAYITLNFCLPLPFEPAPMMKKMVVKVEINDERAKQKVLKAVSGLSGVESISIDLKDKKLTVIGNVDAVKVVSKLRKAWHTEIVSIGDNKKEEPKKEEPKKEEHKKDPNQMMFDFIRANPHLMSTHFYSRSIEEDPNSCVIC